MEGEAIPKEEKQEAGDGDGGCAAGTVDDGVEGGVDGGGGFWVVGLEGVSLPAYENCVREERGN